MQCPPPCLQVALEVEAARKAAEAQARIEVEALEQRLRWATRLVMSTRHKGELCMACCMPSLAAACTLADHC